MSGNSKDEFNTIAHYNFIFIPFIDEDNVKWAVYDTEFTRDLDSTNLLLDAITNEIEDKHSYITKERLDAQAQAYDAKPIFDCNDENSIEYLQNILGKYNADDYLNRFGFTDDKKYGFSIKSEEPDIEEITDTHFDETLGSDNKIQEERKDESITEFNSAGSVPASDDEYWAAHDVHKLLRSALVFKQREIDNNGKGSVKEAISDAFAVYVTATAATGPSIFATSSGLISMALMGYNAMQDSKDRDEILKDWALFQKDRNDPNVNRKEAEANLKKNMQNSSFAYEGIPDNITYDEYKGYKPFFNRLAKLQGHFDDPKPENDKNTLNADKVKIIGNRVKGIKPKLARIIGLKLFQAKHATYLVKEGTIEVGTNLKHLFNFNDSSMRKKMCNDITGAGKITAGDIKQIQKHKLKKEEEAKHHKDATQSVATIKEGNEHIKSKYRRVEDDNIRTTPDIIHAEIDYLSYERYIDTLEQLPQLRKDKGWAELNYANVSTSMVAQISGLINGVFTLNPIDIMSNTFGIFTGIGAFAQMAYNVIKIDDKVHGELAVAAEHHEYVKEMQTSRLMSNLVKENFPDKEGDKEGDKESPLAEELLDNLLEDNTPS